MTVLFTPDCAVLVSVVRVVDLVGVALISVVAFLDGVLPGLFDLLRGCGDAFRPGDRDRLRVGDLRDGDLDLDLRLNEDSLC